MGISLFNKTLVFDEGHNILETVSSLNTVKVSYSQLYLAYTEIQQYLRKYGARLSASNSKFLKDIVNVCACFVKYLKKRFTENKEEVKQ